MSSITAPTAETREIAPTVRAPWLLPGGYELLAKTFREGSRSVGLWVSLAFLIGCACCIFVLERMSEDNPWRPIPLSGNRRINALAQLLSFATVLILTNRISGAMGVLLSEEMAALVQMAGLRTQDLWRARVWGSAVHALLIPLVLAPFAMLAMTFGGVETRDFLIVLGWWLQWSVFVAGLATMLAFLQRKKDNTRLTAVSAGFASFGLISLYGMLWTVGPLMVELAWMYFVQHDHALNNPQPWLGASRWLVSPMGPATTEWFVAGGIHTCIGLLMCKASLIGMRGRYRSMRETSAKKRQ